MIVFRNIARTGRHGECLTFGPTFPYNFKMDSFCRHRRCREASEHPQHEGGEVLRRFLHDNGCSKGGGLKGPETIRKNKSEWRKHEEVCKLDAASLNGERIVSLERMASRVLDFSNSISKDFLGARIEDNDYFNSRPQHVFIYGAEPKFYVSFPESRRRCLDYGSRSKIRLASEINFACSRIHYLGHL